MDSGLIQKARHIKHTFGPAFYHPHALAVIAPYNAHFGRCFGELFATAAACIKSYAHEVQQRGGSLSSRVEGDVTVQHLTQLEEQIIFGTEYRRAQDHLRHLSKLKKAVDSKMRNRARDPVPALQAVHHSALPTIARAASANPVATAPPPASVQFTDPAQLQEEARIRSVEESIRGWVRAADERCRQIVPMKFGNFVLAPPEADAYCAEFHQEKSFRGDNARVLVRMVAVMARIQAESEELKQRQNSAHLWRPHAEALARLQQAAARANQNALIVVELASQRGLVEKAKILAATMDRLRLRVEQVQETFAMAGLRLETTPK